MLKSRVFGIDFGSEGVFTSCEDANEQSGQSVATLFQSATTFQSSSPHPQGGFALADAAEGDPVAMDEPNAIGCGSAARWGVTIRA
jgi:hypothetical protein